MSRAHPLLRCLAFYRRMPWRFALCTVLYTIVNLSIALYQYLIGRAVHDVEQGSAVVRLADGALDFSLAWQWVTVLVGVALGRSVLQYAAGIVSLIIGQELLFHLREAILIQIQRLDLAYHFRHGVGEIVTRTTRDADKVRDALVSVWRNVFETGLVIFAAIGILCWYHPLLGLVPAGFTVLGMAMLVRQTDRLVRLDRAVGDAYDAVNQDLTEGVNGVRVIKAFGLEQARTDRFKTAVAAFVDHAATALAYATSHIPLPQIVVSLGQVWVLGFGARLVVVGRLNIGELVASLLAMNTLVFRFEGIGRVMQVFADARSSAARIMELLDEEPTIESGSAPVPGGPLGLRLSNVRVVAPGGSTDVLRDCSLVVRPGDLVALVGATGSGKSTLACLVPRLVDADQGDVSVGSDAGGWRDVREIETDELRRRVHVVPQDCFLFSDTVRANLLLGNPAATDAELDESLRLAAAQEIVSGLPDGLETRIGDRGVTLSGGQRQRLTLARAFIGRPSILVLDDATSALDAVTERTILTNVRALSDRSCATTMLVIASKLSTILLADRVAVLAGGRIVAEGTHSELSRSNSTYRELLGIERDHENGAVRARSA